MSEKIGPKFMQLSKPQFAGPSDQSQGVPQPPLELDYPLEHPLIHLPDHHNLQPPAADLWAVIDQRVTLRRYSEQTLTLTEISLLLWTTQGVKEVTPRPVTLRTVPSAGARHAFETFLLVNRVEGLQPGLYRYVALEHALLPVDLSEDVNARLTKACFDQKQVATSAVTFFWVAVAERMTWRYGDRGYRYMLLDAGHVCQNLYLAAEGIGCGVCAIAAYDDDAANAALHLDGEALFVIYAASLGKRPLSAK